MRECIHTREDIFTYEAPKIDYQIAALMIFLIFINKKVIRNYNNDIGLIAIEKYPILDR